MIYNEKTSDCVCVKLLEEALTEQHTHNFELWASAGQRAAFSVEVKSEKKKKRRENCSQWPV